MMLLGGDGEAEQRALRFWQRIEMLCPGDGVVPEEFDEAICLQQSASSRGMSGVSEPTAI